MDRAYKALRPRGMPQTAKELLRQRPYSFSSALACIARFFVVRNRAIPGAPAARDGCSLALRASVNLFIKGSVYV